MATAAPKPCTKAGCSALVYDGGGACDKHRPAAWSVKRPTPTKRITGRRLQRSREQLFRRHPLCVECLKAGRVTVATERDHIIPLFDGGADDESNTQALCEPCHDLKSAAERQRSYSRRGGLKV
ncbi:HNH endonuclease [Alcaligenaceae bacterium]|nr:HNH endonuclease [Alcaligenaceae bacterium]